MRAEQEGKRYIAKMLLWHSREERYIEQGSEVDLSHLSPEDVQRLVEMGAVEVLDSIPEVKEE